MEKSFLKAYTFITRQRTGPSLKAINPQVKAGETVALVGPSGTGKSTLIALLQRFYDPVYGNIYIDQHNILSLKKQSFRRNTDVVLQDAFLFNESIRDIFACGKPEAGSKEIEGRRG